MIKTYIPIEFMKSCVDASSVIVILFCRAYFCRDFLESKEKSVNNPFGYCFETTALSFIVC